MKKIILIFAAVVFSMQCNFAFQTDSEINIKQIVRNQIENARAKAKKSVEQFYERKSAPVERIIKTYRKAEFGNVSETSSILTKLAIIAGASALAFSFVFIRRKKAASEKLSALKLKNNIKMMRSERPYININGKLKRRRKKLRLIISPRLVKTGAASKIAKKLNISSGEVLLAAAINSNIKKSSKLSRG